jgi:hypothetical protein
MGIGNSTRPPHPQSRPEAFPTSSITHPAPQLPTGRFALGGRANFLVQSNGMAMYLYGMGSHPPLTICATKAPASSRLTAFQQLFGILKVLLEPSHGLQLGLGGSLWVALSEAALGHLYLQVLHGLEIQQCLPYECCIRFC